MTALVANRYRRHVVGVKIAHYSGHDWEPYRRTVKAAELAGVPVMVDFGSARPALALETLFFDVLRPGDIYTNMYGGGLEVRQAGVAEGGRLRRRMREARGRRMSVESD